MRLCILMKRLRQSLIVLSLFIHFLQAQVFQDTLFQNQALRGLDLLYNMDFAKAQHIFTTLSKEYPREPAPHFLNALNTWWKISISRDYKGYDAAFLREIDSAEFKAAHLAKKSEHRMEYAFIMFNTLAFKARYYAMREEWMTAGNTARKSLPFLLEGKKYLNQNFEFHFALGLYDYFSVYYPEKYPVTKPLMVFFPQGNKMNGIRLLEQASVQKNYSRNEARFFLMRILTDDEPDYAKALEMAKFLSRKYPANTVYRLYLGKLYFLNGEYESAKTIFQSMEKIHMAALNKEQKRIDQIHSLYTSQIMFNVWYYLGKMFLQNPPLALVYFSKSEGLIKICQERDAYIESDLLLQMGICLDRMGKRESALSYYKQVLKNSAPPEIKKKATECIKSPCVK